MTADDGQAPAPASAFPVTFGDVGWMLLAAAAFALLFAGISLAIFATGIDLMSLGGSQAFVFFATMLQSAFIVGCVYGIAMRRRGLDWRGIGWRPITGRWIILAIVIALAALPVINLLTAAVQTVLDRPIRSPQAEMLAPEGFSWFAVFAMLLAAGIVAPFAEELAFRGVLYRLLRKYWPVLPSALVSAFLFGLLHGILEVYPGTMLLGFVMALAYERSGSLWVPFTIHATFNSVSLLLLFLFLASGVDLTGPPAD